MTLACLDAVVRDAHTLFMLYDRKLGWIIKHKKKVFAQWDSEEANTLLEHFVKFRKDKLGAFQAFFKDSSALLELYGSKRVPGELLLPATPPYASL